MGAWAGGRRHRRRQLPMHGPPAWPDRTVHSAVHRATQRARTHGGSARARARPAGRKCTHAPTWRLHARSPGGGPRPHIPLVFEEKAKCRMRGRRPHVRARALARMHTQTRARGEDGVGHRALRTRGSHSRLEDPPPSPPTHMRAHNLPNYQAPPMATDTSGGASMRTRWPPPVSRPRKRGLVGTWWRPCGDRVALHGRVGTGQRPGRDRVETRQRPVGTCARPGGGSEHSARLPI